MKTPRVRNIFLILAALAFLFPACKTNAPADRPITANEIEAHIRFLSDDLLEGRLTGTRGVEIAALYQEQYFRLLGLEPAFDGSYRQPFEVKGCLPAIPPSLTIKAGGRTLTLEPGKDFVMRTYREDIPQSIAADLVYVGFGVQAPERDWDDLKGMDVKGKVLLVEINEPGNGPGGLFDGEQDIFPRHSIGDLPDGDVRRRQRHAAHAGSRRCPDPCWRILDHQAGGWWLAQPTGSLQEDRRVRLARHVVPGDQLCKITADAQQVHQQVDVLQRRGGGHRLRQPPALEFVQPGQHARKAAHPPRR